MLLHHPQVVEFARMGYAAGVFFFTLDYCPGGQPAQDDSETRVGPCPSTSMRLYPTHSHGPLHYVHTFPPGTGSYGTIR